MNNSRLIDCLLPYTKPMNKYHRNPDQIISDSTKRATFLEGWVTAQERRKRRRRKFGPAHIILLAIAGVIIYLGTK